MQRLYDAVGAFYRAAAQYAVAKLPFNDKVLENSRCKLQNTLVRHKLYSHVCSKIHMRDSLYKSTIKVLSMLLRRNLSD